MPPVIKITPKQAPFGMTYKIGIPPELAREFLDAAQAGEWSNWEVKPSKYTEGGFTVSLDTWKPTGKRQDAPTPPPVPEPAGNRYDAGDALAPDAGNDDEIPF